MKVTLLAVGKLREAWVREGCDEYKKRLRGKLPFDEVELRDDAELEKRLPSRGQIWALDERGTEMTSDELARRLRAVEQSEPLLTLVIGGADGLPAAAKQRAHFQWSLGRLTLPHRLARLIVTEQLYRAVSILRGEPYHRP